MIEPLEQFLSWHNTTKGRRIDDTTMYGLLKEAFYAGYAARPAEPPEPSRHALDDRSKALRRYSSPPPLAYVGPANRGKIVPMEPPTGPQPSLRAVEDDSTLRPEPDYVQHSTITGRITSINSVPEIISPFFTENERDYEWPAGRRAGFDHTSTVYDPGLPIVEPGNG